MVNGSDRMPKLFHVGDLDRAAHAFSSGSSVAWDEFRGQHMSLPDWYNWDLDPLAPEYMQQQDRLWHLIAGRQEAYNPQINEQAPDVRKVDALTRPGFYLLDSETAGHHLIALGHLVKLSSVAPGDRVLEYGAGFGQIALAFARLGAAVDTVDINPDFCDAVTAQAKWFNVKLSAHNGQFGDNPRPGEQYKLIVFYECFHHARNFVKLIGRLHQILAEDGRILLAGEPIVPTGSPDVPYPWGMRLDLANTAVVRLRGWYEIGFEEDFLLRCFVRGGFMARKYDGMISTLANTYEFRKRPNVIKLADWPLIPVDEATWHTREKTGRWTTKWSTFYLDQTTTWTAISLLVHNFHAQSQTVYFKLGKHEIGADFKPGETKSIRMPRGIDAHSVAIVTNVVSPTDYGVPDERKLGIFVEQIEFLG